MLKKAKQLFIVLLLRITAAIIRAESSVMEDIPHMVRIRIANTLEQPIGNASIQLFCTGGGRSIDSGSTDSNGEYVFSAVMPGNYYVTVAASGYQPEQEYFSVSMKDVTVNVTLLY